MQPACTASPPALPLCKRPCACLQLAANADIFVNDAFGTAHRAHASTEGVTKYLHPSVAGAHATAALWPAGYSAWTCSQLISCLELHSNWQQQVACWLSWPSGRVAQQPCLTSKATLRHRCACLAAPDQTCFLGLVPACCLRSAECPPLSPGRILDAEGAGLP